MKENQEKKQDCRVELYKKSGRYGIIIQKGDYLCFDNRRFCFDGTGWTETTEEVGEE